MMQRTLRVAMVALIVSTIVLGAAGCKKANPDDPETQALAKQFMEAVYVSHDSVLAMSLVVPIDTYGYVTTKIVEDSVATTKKQVYYSAGKRAARCAEWRCHYPGY